MDKFARLKFQPCLPLGKDGRRVTASEEHIALSRAAAAEGTVLLKNEDKALPLRHGEKVALFGKATIEYIKGGGGSGDVNSPFVKNIYDGFSEKEKEGKLSVYMPTVDFYSDYVKSEAENVLTESQINKIWDKVNAMEFCTERDDITYDTFSRMHVKEPRVPDDLIRDAAKSCDTAVVTLSRFSAEGVDRRPLGDDYYLSDVEKDLFEKLAAVFKKIVVIINSGAIIDCEYFAENPKISAVLIVWQGGLMGGCAAADVVSGDVNPSGKLPDTIAKSYDSYPTVEEFWECFDHLDYSDDIYVGYRYFETVPGAFNKVRYEFGYGLSYTSFSFTGALCGENDGVITAAVTVTNTGSTAGKEVCQLYYSAPDGKLGKPKRVLAAWEKTKLLLPGESEVLALSFKVTDMASFDDLGKIKKSAYVLEKGSYEFYLGNSVRNAEKLGFVFSIEEDTVAVQLNQLCRPFKLKRRMKSDGQYEELPVGEASYYYGVNEPSKAKSPEKLTMFSDVGEAVSVDEFIKQFTLDELMDFVGGQPPTGVANTGCFGGLKRLGVPSAPTADGPAGLRLNTETGIPTTAWPCATLIAASWNTELAHSIGAAAAAEIRENNIGVWLAPAMNIHRDPMCGRNFEYYSEDPVLAGKTAAAAIRGIQSCKVAVSLKHFACNNKEANRFACDSRLSERALREIYLKGFEIAVKEGNPWTVMSSYNLINGCHTSESYELLTGILRDEWGFDGMVTTDWGVKNDPVKEVKSGNDMKMHRGYPDDLKKAFDEGKLTRADLELSVKRILGMINRLAED